MFSGKTYQKTVYLSFSCYFPCLGQNHCSLAAVMAGHIVITFKITTLWIFWTNDRKIMDTFKMGLHCLQLVTTDYITGGICMYL